MPRDGSNVYHRPSGIDAVTNTTISSTAYNLNVQDVESDLNLPRPIVAGGTGANNAASAMQNLGGELAKQSVTNYDATVFQAGSFYSATSATGSPVAGHAFNGICYVTDANNMTIEARDVTNGYKYARIMTAGVWGSWSPDSGGGQFVLKAGDTMTGNLTIAPTSGSVNMYLNHPTGAQANAIYGLANGLGRWGVVLGTAEAESSGNVGSNFAVMRYNDAGTLLDYPLSINRASGVTVLNNLTVTGTGTGATSGTINLTASNGCMEIGSLTAANTPFIDFHSSGNSSTDYDVRLIASGGSTATGAGTLGVNAAVTNFNGAINAGTTGVSGNLNCNGTVACGGVSCNGNVLVGTSSGALIAYSTAYVGYSQANAGTLYFGSAANTYLTYSGAYEFGAAAVCRLGGGFAGRQGVNGGAWGSIHNFYWNNTLLAYVDTTFVGTVSLTSDYRIKKDVIDLPGMWDTVKALRPIKFTYDNFTPPAQIEANKQALADHLERVADAKAKGVGEPPPPIIPEMPMFKADDVERWGFIAHELQETLIMDAATGVKDSPDTVQSPNPWTVIAALTKALQEAMARIEALEAR